MLKKFYLYHVKSTPILLIEARVWLLEKLPGEFGMWTHYYGQAVYYHGTTMGLKPVLYKESILNIGQGLKR